MYGGIFSNEFGNRSPTWNDWRSYQEARYLGPVHIRNRVAGAKTWYDVSYQDFPKVYRQALAEGFLEENLYISAMCPTDRTLIQGEVYRSELGLCLYYSTIPKPMRESLSEGGQQVVGLTSLMLLKKNLNTKSLEWLEYLLETYENHVVEFTCLDCNWGTNPGYNTLFWEVRLY